MRRKTEPDYRLGWNNPPLAPTNTTQPELHPSVASTIGDGPEFLPEDISGIMERSNDNACPAWNNPTQAKEIIVFLTGAIKIAADATRDMTAGIENLLRTNTVDPEQAYEMNQPINENRAHIRALTACRDAIARSLGLNALSVQQLCDYNTLKENDYKMFNDLEMDNYAGQPDFSKLVGMPDQRWVLHMIDLYLRNLDFGIKQSRAMIANDAGKPTEEGDRKALSNQINFREKLVSVRASIANRLNAAPIPLTLQSPSGGDQSSAANGMPDARTERSWLGVRVQEVTSQIAEGVGLPKVEGALVASVTPGGPAEKIGIKSGDVIEAYRGQDIVKMHDLLTAVAGTQTGERVNVKIWRYGHVRLIPVHG